MQWILEWYELLMFIVWIIMFVGTNIIKEIVSASSQRKIDKKLDSLSIWK